MWFRLISSSSSQAFAWPPVWLVEITEAKEVVVVEVEVALAVVGLSSVVSRLPTAAEEEEEAEVLVEEDHHHHHHHTVDH